MTRPPTPNEAREILSRAEENCWRIRQRLIARMAADFVGALSTFGSLRDAPAGIYACEGHDGLLVAKNTDGRIQHLRTGDERYILDTLAWRDVADFYVDGEWPRNASFVCSLASDADVEAIIKAHADQTASAIFARFGPMAADWSCGRQVTTGEEWDYASLVAGGLSDAEARGTVWPDREGAAPRPEKTATQRLNWARWRLVWHRAGEPSETAQMAAHYAERARHEMLASRVPHELCLKIRLPAGLPETVEEVDRMLRAEGLGSAEFIVYNGDRIVLQIHVPPTHKLFFRLDNLVVAQASEATVSNVRRFVRKALERQRQTINIPMTHTVVRGQCRRLDKSPP